MRVSTLAKYCPASGARGSPHVPTVILKPSQKLTDPTKPRTHYINSTSPSSFLTHGRPPLSFGSTVPAALLDGTPVAARAGAQICAVHRVPSSPIRPNKPQGWRDSFVMLGMATTPERALRQYPIWASWLPHKWDWTPPDLSSTVEVRDLPQLMLLVPPVAEADQKGAKELESMRRVVAEGSVFANVSVLGEVDRQEKRYFSLAREMWHTTLARETQGHIKVQWFLFA